MRVKALTKEGIYIYQIPLMITSLCCHIVRNCRNYLHINLLCNAEKARLGYVYTTLSLTLTCGFFYYGHGIVLYYAMCDWREQMEVQHVESPYNTEHFKIISNQVFLTETRGINAAFKSYFQYSKFSAKVKTLVKLIK